MLWLSRLKGNDSSHAAGKFIAGYVGCQPARNLSQASCLRTPVSAILQITNPDAIFLLKNSPKKALNEKNHEKTCIYKKKMIKLHVNYRVFRNRAIRFFNNIV